MAWVCTCGWRGVQGWPWRYLASIATALGFLRVEGTELAELSWFCGAVKL